MEDDRPNREQRYVRAAHSGEACRPYEFARITSLGLTPTAEIVAAYRLGHVDGWDDLAEAVSRTRSNRRKDDAKHVTRRTRKTRSDKKVVSEPMVDNDAQSA